MGTARVERAEVLLTKDAHVHRARKHRADADPGLSACNILGGITRPTLYRLINGGEIDRVKIGTRMFITATSLRAYVDRQMKASATCTASQALIFSVPPRHEATRVAEGPR